MKSGRGLLIALGLANLALLVPPFRLAGAIALALVLPGWGWAVRLWPGGKPLPRLTLSLGLSYAVAAVGTLLLHYLPGPVARWQLLLLLNAAALLPLSIFDLRFAMFDLRPSLRPLIHPLTAVLLLALFVRAADLGYSEFQGDEALAMISAAETLEGHADALFLRGKGPAEVLLPAAVWRLAGPITEGAARLPFAVAGMMGIVTLYLLAAEFLSERAALYGAAILAAGGFSVGFSRIVQYQTLVLWMSALSLWGMWRAAQTGRKRWAFVSGLFLGVGLLAHYDAILVIPALGWLWLRTPAPLGRRATSGGLWLAGFTGSAGLFYLPYLLDPQFGRTGDYVGGRIGTGLQNNLSDFFRFYSFYSSFYYLLLAGLLLAAFLVWAIGRWRWGRQGVSAVVAGLALAALALKPDAAGNGAGIVAGLLLLAAFASPALNLSLRTALLWFAGPFLGYNFLVATPLTHIYTVLPGWALLAGWAAAQLRLHRTAALAIGGALLLLSTGYLWNAFVRHDVEFWQDYPAGNLPLYVTPYPDPPPTGFFGFAHKSGWKSVGALLNGEMPPGDYNSNEEEDVTAWYTRHAPRACDPGAEYYFIAADAVDPIPLPDNPAGGEYAPVGTVQLPNGKGLTVHQRLPASVSLGELDNAQLEHRFDHSAYPAAFARRSRPQVPLAVNFGGKIKLAGYSLDTRRAYPGGRIVLTLYWQAQQPVAESYKVFVHLDSERKYAQADSIPVCARYPTDLWRPGQTIADRHALALPLDVPPGEHPLVVGLYLPDSGLRLDVLDAAGNPAGVGFTLAEVAIGD
ncbi:MAG: ArnT family glycosyltransferase [Anaerolineae bacterium]